MRILGIDYGRSKVGLAISDVEQKVAFPLEVVFNSKTLVSEISYLCQDRKISKIVIGRSLDTVDRPNPIMSEAEQLGKRLKEVTELPIEWEPEQFTTQEAKKVQGRSKKLDASAAALILQSFLERQSKC